MIRIPFSRAACENSTNSPSVPIARIDAVVIADVIPVIATRRWKKWLQPDAVDVEAGQVIQFSGQPEKIPDAVAVSVREGLQVDGVDDRIFMPEAFHMFRST